MPAKGISQVRRKLQSTFERIRGPMSERTVAEVLAIGGGYAALLTPVDTSNLINSRYEHVVRGRDGVHGVVGFTADYALAVHEASGKLDGQPRGDFGTTRAGASFGGGTGTGSYWDPDAEPQFLLKGFERDGKQDIQAAIKRGMQL